MTEIIDNITTNNHKQFLTSLISNADEFLCASPYLAVNIDSFFESLRSISDLKKFTLLTTLKPNDEDQIYKMQTLPKIATFCNTNSIDFEILINNRLHGKVYLFKKNNKFIDAVISSANFTENGMEKNLEWGVHFNDTKTLCNITQNLFLAPQTRILSLEDLQKMSELFNEYKTKHIVTLQNKPNINLDLISSLSTSSIIHDFKTNVTYWMKPIGDTNNPVTADWKFEEEIFHIDFSKIRPSGIRKDDIIINYGVGCEKILSVCKIISEQPQHATEEEIKEAIWKKRWPWSFEVENLSCDYGKNWNKYNFTLGSLKDEFCKIYPQSCITASGNNSFGRFSFGGDKLKLNPMFANFVIQKIFNAHK